LVASYTRKEQVVAKKAIAEEAQRCNSRVMDFANCPRSAASLSLSLPPSLPLPLPSSLRNKQMMENTPQDESTLISHDHLPLLLREGYETIPDAVANGRRVKPPPKKSTFRLAFACKTPVVSTALEVDGRASIGNVGLHPWRPPRIDGRNGPTAGSRATDPPSTRLRAKVGDIGDTYLVSRRAARGRRWIVEAPHSSTGPF
ncbi:hypothetical protein THAOC_10886, partial [Thalassiosira oceanica]